MDHIKPTKLFSEFPPVSTEAWEEKIIADLKGADYHKKLFWKTDEGFEVKPYYRAEDLDGLEFAGSPHSGTLNTSESLYQTNEWKVRQDIDSVNIPVINTLATDAVAKGATALGLNANLVTSRQLMGELLAGIDLHQTAVNFTSAASYPLVLEFLVYELTQRETGGSKIKGSVNFDPLSYLLLHGNLYISWENNMDEAAYLLNIARQHLPGFKIITVNGHYFQDAGSSLVQELAFSLASACEYLSCLTDKGISVDDIAPYVQFSLGVGPNYFMEIAKLRAARILWSRMIEQFRAKDEKSFSLFIHSTTALWNKSIYDPYVNMLRTTTESMAAVLGNSDSVTTLPFDISFREPDEISRRIARNQQLVLKEESYLDQVSDPAAGSYYIENLTYSIASHAWDLFRDIESKGGMLECIGSGFIRGEIERSKNQKVLDIANRKMIMLGTNQYPNPLETMYASIHTSKDIVEAGFSEGVKLQPFRITAGFEEIRLATEQFVNQGNKRPSVFLFTMGNLAMLRARAGFAANFFGCAGYEIIDNPGFQTAGEGVQAFLSSGAEIVVICSSDEEYPAIVPEIAGSIKSSGSQATVVVAGFLKDYVEPFKAAGIDDFIHMRCNLLDTLKEYQHKLGIK